jgi:hypothetical protein
MAQKLKKRSIKKALLSLNGFKNLNKSVMLNLPCSNSAPLPILNEA